MRPVTGLLLTALLSATVVSAAPRELPRGDQRFRLGMMREEIEAVARKRGVAVISDEPLFLVTAGEAPGIEYVQYAFFSVPHAEAVLWKVTYGWQLGATARDFAVADSLLREHLKSPPTASRAPAPDADPRDTERQASWTDGRTLVRLGGRWPEQPAESDRMMLEWSDVRTRHAVASRAKPSKK